MLAGARHRGHARPPRLAREVRGERARSVRGGGLRPFGRARGQVSSFRQCRERTCYANWLGAQVGTSFDRPAEDWYFGLVIEPVSGLAVGLGAALRKGEFLAPGLAEGMLLPSRNAFGTRTEYMARPYLGLTITTDVFHTIDRGALSLRRLR